MPANFDTFFRTATSGQSPYGYQCRLAGGPRADPANPHMLTAGRPCKSQFINIPTGLAVI